MSERQRTPRGKGEGSIYEDWKQPGRWKASLDFGVVAGRRVRKVRNARTKTEAGKLLKAMLAERDALAAETGRTPTVAGWMRTWLDICGRKLRDQTVSGYEQYNRLYITPELGRLRLSALRVEHIEALYTSMDRAGKSSGTVHSCHRILRASLNAATRRGLIRANPAALAEPGRLVVKEFEPLSAEEARAVLEAAQGRRNGARWSVALALGLRQGEALGLMWADVDLETGELWVRRSVHRSAWTHGCRVPERCTYVNSKGARVAAKRGTDCPKRVGGGYRMDQPKTAKSRRPLALSERMVAQLKAHRTAQTAERLAAGSMWRGGPHGGLVFATVTGLPVARRDDWADLLIEARVPHRRVHDARHTAATLALLQGLPEQTVMMMFGWSQPAMLARYQHFVGPVARQAAQAMDDALFGGSKPVAEPKKRRRRSG